MPCKQLGCGVSNPKGAAQAQILPKCHRRCCHAASTVAKMACGKARLFIPVAKLHLICMGIRLPMLIQGIHRYSSSTGLMPTW